MLSKSQIQELKLAVVGRPQGVELTDIPCPSCGGGNNNDRAFSVKIDSSGILFNCFRASCDERGFIPFSTTIQGEDKKKVELSVFRYATRELNDLEYQVFEDTYGITAQELIDNGVVKCPERNSFVLPAYNFMGFQIGTMERWFKWSGLRDQGGKAKYWRETDYPKMCVPKSCTLADHLIVVEDTLSAIKVGRITTSCALLGSSLGNELLLKFKEAGIKTLTILLDPDAFNTSIRIQKEYGLYFREIRTILLPKDPKDMPFNELQERLDEHQIQATET